MTSTLMWYASLLCVLGGCFTPSNTRRANDFLLSEKVDTTLFAAVVTWLDEGGAEATEWDPLRVDPHPLRADYHRRSFAEPGVRPEEVDLSVRPVDFAAVDTPFVERRRSLLNRLGILPANMRTDQECAFTHTFQVPDPVLGDNHPREAPERCKFTFVVLNLPRPAAVEDALARHFEQNRFMLDHVREEAETMLREATHVVRIVKVTPSSFVIDAVFVRRGKQGWEVLGSAPLTGIMS